MFIASFSVRRWPVVALPLIPPAWASVIFTIGLALLFTILSNSFPTLLASVIPLSLEHLPLVPFPLYNQVCFHLAIGLGWFPVWGFCWTSLGRCVLRFLLLWSQLWSPNKTGDIQSLELLQKAFVRKIRGMSALSYWDQLIKLKLYSLERCRERYQVIYTWRIIERHVPNFDCTPIQSYKNSRRRRECRVPPSPPVLLVLYRQSGFLLSLSRGPACSMYYPRTCGICLAALLRGLSVNWTATWLLYQMSPWCQASPSTGDVTATGQILHTWINRTTSSSNTITWS